MLLFTTKNVTNIHTPYDNNLYLLSYNQNFSKTISNIITLLTLIISYFLHSYKECHKIFKYLANFTFLLNCLQPSYLSLLHYINLCSLLPFRHLIFVNVIGIAYYYCCFCHYICTLQDYISISCMFVYSWICSGQILHMYINVE